MIDVSPGPSTWWSETPCGRRVTGRWVSEFAEAGAEHDRTCAECTAIRAQKLHAVNCSGAHFAGGCVVPGGWLGHGPGAPVDQHDEDVAIIPAVAAEPWVSADEEADVQPRARYSAKCYACDSPDVVYSGAVPLCARCRAEDDDVVVRDHFLAGRATSPTADDEFDETMCAVAEQVARDDYAAAYVKDSTPAYDAYKAMIRGMQCTPTKPCGLCVAAAQEPSLTIAIPGTGDQGEIGRALNRAVLDYCRETRGAAEGDE